MNYNYRVETDFHGGYFIKRRDTDSLDNPWCTVARIDSENGFSYSDFIVNSNEKKEIENYVTLAALI